MGVPLLNGIAHLDQFQLTFTLAVLCGIKAEAWHVQLVALLREWRFHPVSSCSVSVAATQLSIWLVECSMTLTGVYK